MNNKRILIKNTAMLYILRFSTYFFSFISVPYQTRVMGAEVYGRIGVATALMMYFELFLDFGFILSATEAVARNRDNKAQLKKIYTSVTVLKLIFSIISFVILLGGAIAFPKYKSDIILYLLFLIGTIINSFLPDFLYRGLEDMSSITYRTVFTKAFFTVLIFVFLRSKEDYIVVPILLLCGNLFAVLWSMYDVKRRFDISFCRVDKKNLGHYFKNSRAFFLSRIISTFYSATNTLILNYINPIGGTVGHYTAAYKLVSTGQSALSPISDSVYPYMIKNKDFKLIKKILMYFMPVIILGCTVAFIFAEPLCVIIFGEEFAGAAPILRAMLPAAVLTLPDYLLGFPTLGAMGMAKHANISIYVSSLLHICNLLLILLANNLTAVSLAALVSLATAVEVAYRAIVVWRNRDNLRKKDELNEVV